MARSSSRLPIVLALALAGPLGTARVAAASEGATVHPVLVPADAPRRRDPTLPAAAPAPAIVYVNFEGAELSAGWDDAAQSRTQVEEMVGSFAPFGDDPSRRAAIMQALHEDWAPYDIEITEEQPADGPYAMVMVGPTNPYGPGTLGIAPLDCGDSQTTSNIAFAFYSADDGRSAVMAATTIGHEVAHTFGLEHVDEATDVMNTFNVGGDPWFQDECLPIEGDVACGPQHQAACGVADEQNAHDELLALLGPSVPDATSPEVAIVAPFDGAAVREGTEVRVEVEADDDQGIAEVRLWENGRLAAMDETRPFGWTLDTLAEGETTFVVEAFDRAGNRARSHEVVVTVEPPSGEPPSSEPLEPLSAPHSGGVPSPARDDESDPGGRTSWEQDGAEVACSASPGRRGAEWVLLGLLAGALRRRRVAGS